MHLLRAVPPLVLAFVLVAASRAEAQDRHIVRQWKGALGTSQFGVFSKDGKRIVYARGKNSNPGR